MIPAAFDYAAPRSLDEAQHLLELHGDEAKLLAGGHSLLPLMKLRLATPAVLVDLARIPGLAYVRDAGRHLAIGPMTTYRALETSDLVRERARLLAEAASTVGDMQVRNRGTIGGSIAHADPAADIPAVAVALGAEVVAVGLSGERTIAAAEFFEDIWTTALQPGEIIREVRLPYGDGPVKQHFEKFRQRAADWATVAVAVHLRVRGETIQDGRVVLTNVGPTPIRARVVEEAVRGGRIDAATVRDAAEQAADGLQPSADLKASVEYKRHLARVLTRRALEGALGLG